LGKEISYWGILVSVFGRDRPLTPRLTITEEVLMDWVQRHSGIREALQRDLSAAQNGADEIISLLEHCDLVLAVDIAAISEAQGRGKSFPPASCCPINELNHWDEEILAVQARLQVARETIARLKSENRQLKEELTWQLP